MSIKNLESFFRRTTFLRLIKKIRREAFKRFLLLAKKKKRRLKKKKVLFFSKFFSFFFFSLLSLSFLICLYFFLFSCPFPFSRDLFPFFLSFSFFLFFLLYFLFLFSFRFLFFFCRRLFPFFCQNRSVGEERGYLEFYIKKQRRNFGESEKKEKYDSEA